MIKCEYISCDRIAEWRRPNAIEQAYNTLCGICFERIYHGYTNYKAAWEKISTPSPQPIPPQPATAEQPTLF